MRQLTEDQANDVYDILISCGLTRAVDSRQRDSFVMTVANDGDSLCAREYRLSSPMGSGMKFRNNGNRDNIPYVDMYQEAETPDCIAAIAEANALLFKYFMDGVS